MQHIGYIQTWRPSSKAYTNKTFSTKPGEEAFLKLTQPDDQFITCTNINTIHKFGFASELSTKIKNSSWFRRVSLKPIFHQTKNKFLGGVPHFKGESPTNLTRPITRFTKNVDIKEKNYRIVSIPSELSGKFPEKYKIISIIDNFHTKQIAVGGNKQVSHGELVQKFATLGLEDQVAVLAYDVGSSKKALSDALSDLHKRIQEEPYRSHIKQLNISRAYNIHPFKMTYTNLSKIVKMEVNESNIVALKSEIVEKLKDGELIDPENPRNPFTFKEVYNGIKAINQLSNAGIDVKIAAGNEGPGTLNLYALSEADVVGATDASGNITKYSSETPLVSSHAPGTYGITAQYDVNGNFLGVGLSTCDRIMFRPNEIGELEQHPLIQKHTGRNVQEVVETSRKMISEALEEMESSQPLNTWEYTSLWFKNKYNLHSGELFEVTDDFHRLAAIQQSKGCPTNLELQLKTNLHHLFMNQTIIRDESKKLFVAWDQDSEQWLKFTEQPDGYLTVDYDNSTMPYQIALISGTSFATPTKLRANITGEKLPTVKETLSLTNTSEDLLNLKSLVDEYDQIMRTLKKQKMILPDDKLINQDELVLNHVGLSREKVIAMDTIFEKFIKTGTLPTKDEVSPWIQKLRGA